MVAIKYKETLYGILDIMGRVSKKGQIVKGCFATRMELSLP